MPDESEARRRALFAMMRDLRQVEAEISEAQRWALAAINDSNDRVANLRKRAADLEQQIASEGELFLVGDSKHVDVPGMGRIQYTDRKPAIKIADPVAFMAALGADERARLVEQKDVLKTNEAKAYAEVVMADGGEIIAGVERVPGQRDHAIKFTEGLR